MIVRTPRLAFEGREAVLRSRLEFADPGRPAFELRLAVSDAVPGMVDGSANGVLPLAGLVAGRLGEDLAVEGTASPRLLEGCEAAARMFADWWGYRVPAITCEAPEPAPWSGEGVGIFYTRGVDTSATLVRSLEGEIPERVTHLVSGDAIEWAFSDEVLREIWGRPVDVRWTFAIRIARRVEPHNSRAGRNLRRSPRRFPRRCPSCERPGRTRSRRPSARIFRRAQALSM